MPKTHERSELTSVRYGQALPTGEPLSRPENGQVNVALQDEHAAIEELFHSLCQRALSDAGREEVIEGLDRASSLCKNHFADEEEFLRTRGNSHLELHVAAHKQLLASIVTARQSVSGRGFPLAALDAADLLYDFRRTCRDV